MKLTIPASPMSDDEVFSTPNCSTFHEECDEVQQIDSGVEEFSTPSAGHDGSHQNDEISYKIMKIQSTGNIPNNKYGVSSLNDVDPNDSGLDDRFSTPDQNLNLYRMRSMGNLSATERAFGDTPKDILKLKKDFELKRFGLAKMRSLTNLVMDDEQENDKKVEMLSKPLPRERVHDINIDMTSNSNYSSFSRSSIRSNGLFFHKKKIGIGDTRWVGGGCEDTDARHFNLTRMKSLGTIPDIIASEPIHPFLTPHTNRKMSIESNSKHRNLSVPDYARLYSDNHSSISNNNDPNNSDSLNDSTDGDDEVIERRSHLEFDHQLFKTPFERGFRRSYTAFSDRNRNHIASPLRQSDGYFSYSLTQSASGSVLSKHVTSSVVLDAKIRSSLNDGFKQPFKIYERYEGFCYYITTTSTKFYLIKHLTPAHPPIRSSFSILN